MVYAFLYQAMDKLLAFIFIPVYWPQIKQWLFMEVYQDHSFQVDSHSVPNAPVGIIKHIYIYIRKKWRDLDKNGFSYRWVLNLLPNMSLGTKSWPPLGSWQHILAVAMLGCPFTLWHKSLALVMNFQEDCRCIWELRVLVRHSEPFKARGPMGICSRTSLMQVHLWYMPY